MIKNFISNFVRNLIGRRSDSSERTKKLRLEALEARELLSVAPCDDALRTIPINSDVAYVNPQTIVDSPIALTELIDLAEPEDYATTLEPNAAEELSLTVQNDFDLAESAASSVRLSPAVQGLLSDASDKGYSVGLRWVYYDDGMYDMVDVNGNQVNYFTNWNESTKQIRTNGPLCRFIDRAHELGLNGMVWKCYPDEIRSLDDDRIPFLQQIKSYAQARGVEIIPTFWTVGGNAFLDQDATLVEGKLVEKAPMTLNGAVGESDVVVAGENFNGTWSGVPNGWAKTDPSVELGDYVQRVAGVSGYSARVTLPKVNSSDGIQRVFTGLEDGYYYVTCRVKLNAKGQNDYAEMSISDGVNSAYADYKEGNDNYVAGAWGVMTTEIIRVSSGELSVQLSGGGMVGAQFSFDDLEIHSIRETTDFLPIPRDGTPMSVFVKNSAGNYVEIPAYEKNGTCNWRLPDGYAESFKFGYDEASDKYCFYAQFDKNVKIDGRVVYKAGVKYRSVQLVVPAGSRLEGADKIYVDYYEPKANQYADDRYSVCLSEETLYEYFTATAATIQETLHPKTWFLGFDEVTIGGTCETCHSTGLTTAQIFGKSVARQSEIIKNTQGVDPNVQIVVWSDMFDPSHNATETPYQDVNGSLKDAVEYIPKDLIIACWYDGDTTRRQETMTVDKVAEHATYTLKFFSDRGFRTISSSYYDWSKGYSSSEMPPYDLDFNTRGWLTATVDSWNELSGVSGMFYLTWPESGKRDYDYLDSFAAALNTIHRVQPGKTIDSVSLNTSAPKVGQTLTATLSASGAGASDATYLWYRYENAYDAERNRTLDWKIWKKIEGATNSTYVVKSADLGKELKVAVVGIGDYSGTATVETKAVAQGSGATALSTPSLTVNSRVGTTITAGWDSVPGASGYTLICRKSTDSTYTTFKLGANVTSRKITGLDASGSYYIKVRAVGDGTNYTSSPYCATVVSKPPQPSVTLSAPNLSVSSRVGGTITVGWDSDPSASGYTLIYRKSTDSAYTTLNLGASVTSRTLTGLDASGSYYFKIRAVGDGVNVATSAYCATVISKAAVALPTPNLTVKSRLADAITVSWDGVPGASGFTLIYRQSTESAYTTLNLGASATSRKVSGLDPSATYYFKIRAVGNGTSYTSSPYCATVISKGGAVLAAPTISSISTTSSSITIRWKALSGVSKYYVAYAPTGSSAFTSKSVTDGTSFTLTGLAPGASYQFKARAISADESVLNSGWSAVRTAQTEKSNAILELGDELFAELEGDELDAISKSFFA